MKIVIASDHAGYEYKKAIKQHLIGKGHDVTDLGTYSNDSVDYPDFIRPAAVAVAQGKFEKGIILGGSGNGEAMVANRIHTIRCAVCWNTETAKLASEHNNANIISIGQRMVDEATALAIVDTWLETPFAGGRHLARIKKIDNLR